VPAWVAAGHTPIPITDYQGVAADPLGSLYFDGIVNGLHRGAATVDPEIPPDVTATQGFDHIGDIAWDRAEGGRLILPLECYTPGAPNAGNTCGRGAFGVADPRTLRWRYLVPLDPAEIAKAMWAEVSPDGRLVWTSSGGDLLAYRADQIKPGAGPLRAVKRLPGAVPPTGVTGATFYGDRLYLAGQLGGTFEVWSVDVRTGARALEIRRALSGESEGLVALDRPDGVLHWIVTPVDPLGRPPTFPQNELLGFRPARARPGLRVRATYAHGAWSIRAGGPDGPVAGAVVRTGTRWALTSASGSARIAARRGATVTVERADLRPATLR
jgi:hypothetical protein